MCVWFVFMMWNCARTSINMTITTRRNNYSDAFYSKQRYRYIMAAPSQNFVALCLFLNICCSIAIVMINKWIYTHYGFPNVTLTCFHFIMTTIGLLICHQMNLFQHKHLPIRNMIPLAMTFCGFVVFTNLSLETNTVGTYQLMKTMTTPCIMIIQMQFYQKRFSLHVVLTVVRICQWQGGRTISQVQAGVWTHGCLMLYKLRGSEVTDTPFLQKLICGKVEVFTFNIVCIREYQL